MTKQDIAKKVSGKKAIEVFVKEGMTIGLGSGTTSHYMVRFLGNMVKNGFKVVGVTTSSYTSDVANEVGVPLMDLNDTVHIDVVVDGADEVDGEFRMIKGGGACLLWEKIIAKASAKMVAIVDSTKVVKQLGAFPLPIDVIPFGWKSTKKLVEELLESCGEQNIDVHLRGGENNPQITDSKHYILDCKLQKIANPDWIAKNLNHIPGVVEHGLFVGIADAVVVGNLDGSVIVHYDKFKV